MKKIVAMILALMLVLVGVSAMADEVNITGYDNENHTGAQAQPYTFNLTKTYTATYDGAPLPADELSFTVSQASYPAEENAGSATLTQEEQTVANGVVIGTNNKYTVAGGSTYNYTIPVKLPSYTRVGVYTYDITEADTGIAGISYNPNGTLKLKVTVIQDGNVLKVAGVAIRQGSDNTKINSFENEYEAGKLTVSKTVTGTHGDTKKDWHFTVVLTGPTGDKVNAPITFTAVGATAPTTIAAGWNTSEADTTKTVSFTLKSGESVTFENLPKGITYTVLETEAGMDGYTTNVATTNNTGETIAKATTSEAKEEATDPQFTGKITTGGEVDTANFTNDKTIDVDTGIELDTVPYMMIMAIALMGVALMIVRRREEM